MEKIKLTEGDMRHLVMESVKRILREAALDREWHFTSLEGLWSIIKTDSIIAHSDGNTYDASPSWAPRPFPHVSLSRIRSNAEGYAATEYMDNRYTKNGCLVRIEFDGRMLNNIRYFKTEPFDELWWTSDNKQSSPALDAKSAQEISDFKRWRGCHEFEDSLWTYPWNCRDNKIPNAFKLITRVDILLNPTEDYDDYWLYSKDLDHFRNLYKVNSPWVEKLHFYLDKNGFNYQLADKEITIPQVFEVRRRERRKNRG